MELTCSTALRRSLGVAGFLIGFGLLSAGVASAGDGDRPGPPGLVAGVADVVAPVTDGLALLTHEATAVADPVLESLRPVTSPLLTPVVNAVDVLAVAQLAQPQLARPAVAPPSVPAEVPPGAADAVPEEPRTPVVVPASLPDRVADVPRPRRISAPDVDAGRQLRSGR